MKTKFVYFLPILCGIMWGSAGIFVRTLSEMGMDSFTIVSTRAMMAAITILVGILCYDWKLLKIDIKDIWMFAGASVLGMFGVNICYNIAIEELTLSLAAVLLSMSPVFVLFLAAILFKEKITRKKVGCMLLALTGCVLVSGVLEASSNMQWSVKGILLGVGCAFFYSLYNLFSKFAIEKGYHAATSSFYSMFIIMLMMLPMTNWQSADVIVKEKGVSIIIFIFFHALCLSVLPSVLFTLSLKYIEAGKAAILTSVEPVAAMVFGVLFFAEIPTVLSVSGLVLTLIALTIMTKSE